MTPTIAVAGNVNADACYLVGRLPQPGETLLADGFRLGPGGKAGNGSVAIARLGGRPRLVGSIGDDALATVALAGLEREGVAVDGLARQHGVSTGMATVFVAPPGHENAIITHLGANLHMAVDDVPSLDGCDGLLMTLGLPMPVLLAAVVAAHAAGATVIVDATPLRALPLPRALTEVDLLSANRVECEALTGTPVDRLADPSAICAPMHALGARHVVVKLGDAGAVWSDGAHAGRASAPRVDAIDPTGAGDAFMGALTVRWLSGSSLASATAFACAVGALASTELGAQGGWSTLEDVERFLSQQRKTGVTNE
jgi:ribokinase